MREFWGLAGRQHGAVSHSQALASGLTDAQVDYLLAKGEIVHMHQGVYRATGAPMTAMQRSWAALLAGGDAAVLAGRTAGGLWAMRDIWPREPELLVPYARHPELRGVLVHRTTALDPADVVQRTDGLRLTSPARTAHDIGWLVPRDVADSATIDALHRKLMDWSDLTDVLARIGGRGRRGTAALRAFLESYPEGVAALESELELRFWRLVRDYGLPEPIPQHKVILEGKKLRIDFAYLQPRRVALEVFGKRWHLSRADRRRDRERAALLVAYGWDYHEFGWDDVVWASSRTAEVVSGALHASLTA